MVGAHADNEQARQKFADDKATLGHELKWAARDLEQAPQPRRGKARLRLTVKPSDIQAKQEIRRLKAWLGIDDEVPPTSSACL